ncbi:MAG: threonine/serine exporter family protein [Acutalibacteraceae bacterium]|nr:threonine/serine exporter family protein [Acutalibacteraceae bacterium]
MKNLLIYAMEIGEQMLISGAEVHRVEESITRMCTAFGAKRTDVFIITSSMVVTVYADNNETHTQTRRITKSDINYEKLHRLNKLSREICEKNLTEQEIKEKLDLAINCKTYPLWLECICYAVIAGAFTLFFGGNLIETLVSFVIGVTVRFGILLSEKAVSNKIFTKFFSSVIASALAFIAVKMGFVDSVDKVIIGNIMTLIPGIGLTNALRDLFTGDSIAGLLRSIEAVLIALAIAAGYFLVVVLGGVVL